MKLPNNIQKVSRPVEFEFKEDKHNNESLIQRVQNEAMAKQLEVENRREEDKESMQKQVD